MTEGIYDKLSDPLALTIFIITLLIPVVGIVNIGGVGVLREMLTSLSPAHLDLFSLCAGVIIGFIGIGLGSPGQPHMVIRYMSIKDPVQLKYSAIFGTCWNIILGVGAVSIGLVGKLLIPDVERLPDEDPEMIYLVLSSGYFGPLLYGLLVGGVFAAILSTADSQLLVVASTFARDLYEKVIARKRQIDEKRKMYLSRAVVILSGFLAIVLAWLAEDLVFWLVLFAWGGLGAAFGPALIMSLFWKGSTKAGIASGMIGGAVICIGWYLWLKEPTGVYELIPAFTGAMLLIVVVSLLTQGKNNESVPPTRY